jgi:flagellar basal-body rod modification protein FlgD
MSIASVSNQQSNQAANSSTGSDAKSLSNNYTMFLQLLTTQLQNQSPLDPMDANQFTSQLVQYSSVEQLIKMNTNLSDVKSSLEASNLASLVNYVGTNVTVDASTQTMANGKVSWGLNAEKAATSATITVKDSSGETVFTQSTTLDKGDNTFTWDGKSTGGKVFTSGDYTVSVTAKSASGTNVKVSTDVTGKVASLEWTDGVPYLVVNGQKYPTSAVTKIAASTN